MILHLLLEDSKLGALATDNASRSVSLLCDLVDADSVGGTAESCVLVFSGGTRLSLTMFERISRIPTGGRFSSKRSTW